MRTIFLNNQRGVVAIVLVFSLLFIALVLALSAAVVFANRLEAMKNLGFSEQSYYAAESGVEDALLRLLDTGMDNPPADYTLAVGGAISAVNTGDLVGGSRTVRVDGDHTSRIRRLSAVLANNTTDASFIYGAQIGDGGLTMENGSRVEGSVYSNGSIIGDNNAEVTGDVIVARNGNSINNLAIGGDAQAYELEDCEVAGDIIFVTGGDVDDCTAGGTTTEQQDEIPPLEMPLSQETIDGWKEDAQAGGTISAGDYKPPKDSADVIGPGVIAGDMILINNQSITLAGTVWVQGNIDIDNGASIALDSSYGETSGILLTDGWIHTKNNGVLEGSGDEGSHLMMLSTVPCIGSEGEEEGDCTHHDAAIDIHNNAEGAMFYATDGLINLHNNVSVVQVNAWGIAMDNNAVLTYETGLADFDFSSGPSGGRSIEAWQEE